jgi:hypothetical protein
LSVRQPEDTEEEDPERDVDRSSSPSKAKLLPVAPQEVVGQTISDL